MKNSFNSINGWVSIDFMIASLIILLTIPGIVAICAENMNTANSVLKLTEAKVLIDNVAETIEMVYTGKEGCSIIFKMPANIHNKPYFLNVNSSGVYVRFDGLMGSSFITPMKLSNGGLMDHSNVELQPDQTYNISNIRDEHKNTIILIKRI
jgi:hypothetical protein